MFMLIKKLTAILQLILFSIALGRHGKMRTAKKVKKVKVKSQCISICTLQAFRFLRTMRPTELYYENCQLHVQTVYLLLEQ